MFDLSTFYQSKEWRKLLDVIKTERVNSEGFIICEHCGKPIVKAYDIIGHHKIELNNENVNDAMISLNPENVALVHHSCHNRIHDKLGYATRQVFLVYGSPLAGKQTWVKDNASEGDLIIDMDSIWQCVSGCKRYVKPNRLKAIVFKTRDMLIESVKYRYGKWNAAYIIGGYPYAAERERLIKDLGAREVFIDTDKAECIRRLQEDKDRNTEEYQRYIEEWFERYGAGREQDSLP